ncbi:hypothetical protein PG984_006790 [Apiospora sp. TS-2023a]
MLSKAWGPAPDPPSLSSGRPAAAPRPSGRKRLRSSQQVESLSSWLSSLLPSSSKKAKVHDEDDLTSFILPPRPDSPTLGICLPHPGYFNEQGDAALDLDFPNYSCALFGSTDEPQSAPSMGPTHNEIEARMTQESVTPTQLSTKTDVSIRDEVASEAWRRGLPSAPTSDVSFQLQLDIAAGMANHAKQSSWWKEKLCQVDFDSSPFQAADYLYAVSNKQRSFALYAQLVELDVASQNILSDALLSCVRAAETRSQRNLARAFLLTRLSSEHRTAGSTEKILAHMLLAHMYSLDGMLAQSESQLGLVIATRGNSTDASFDILAYLYQKQTQEDVPRVGDQGPSGRSTSGNLTSVNRDDFVRYAVGLRYLSLSTQSTEHDGPPDSLLTDCVRSCLNWCAMSVGITSLCQPFDMGWLAQGSSYPEPFRWSDAIVLYNQLYHKWCSDVSERQGSLADLGWSANTRQKLGISAAELLMICCDITIQVHEDEPLDNGWARFETFDYIYDYLGTNIEMIQNMADDALVTIFLRRLYLRISTSAQSPEPAADSCSPLQSPRMVLDSTFSSSQIQLQAEPIDQSPLVSNHCSGLPVDHSLITKPEYDPTIASSCSSSTPSYRRMRDAGSSFVKSYFFKSWSKLSLTSRKGASYVTESTDNLSNMVRDSLSISELPMQPRS